jgi:putative spermidine/putrescine transport system substrate-binding protein
MKRALWFAAVVALAAIAGCGPSQVRPLTVVGWGGTSQAAHRNAYWTSFSKAYHVPIKEDTWSGGIGVLRAKTQGGGDPGWDVIQVETEELILGCEEGVFEKLDWKQLGGRDAFMPGTTQDCGVGAMVWSYLLSYDGDRIKGDGPKSWADFWDLKRWPGKRGMRKTPKYTLEIALMADGVKPEDVYKVLSTPQGVDRAFKKLDEIKPNIVWWQSVSQVPDLLASGEVAMSVTSPGRLYMADQLEHKNFKVVWNQNIQAVDFWAVLHGGPRKADAMKLVWYMTRPENQSRLPDFIPTGPSNRKAVEMMNQKVRTETPLDPENMKNALPLNGQFWVENSDQLTQRFNVWLAR